MSTSTSQPPQVAVDFDRAEGRSFVLVGDLAGRGDWSVHHDSVVKRTPFPQDVTKQEHTLRLIHTNLGAELYRTALPVYEIAHGYPDMRHWSAQIPACAGAGLSVEALNRAGRVLLQYDLDALEL